MLHQKGFQGVVFIHKSLLGLLFVVPIWQPFPIMLLCFFWTEGRELFVQASFQNEIQLSS